MKTVSKNAEGIQKMKKLRALTVYEDTDMYGGAHATNSDTARKAAREGRDIVVHVRHYDGQRYHHIAYRVTNAELCEYAKTGQI